MVKFICILFVAIVLFCTSLFAGFDLDWYGSASCDKVTGIEGSTSYENIGYATAGYYWGVSVAKSGGYTSCKHGARVTSVGTPGTAGHTLYCELWSVDGSGNLDVKQSTLWSVACSDSWSAAWVEYSLSSVSIGQTYAVVLTMNTTDSSNYVRIITDGGPTEDPVGSAAHITGYNWDNGGTRGSVLAEEIAMRFYE
jgi:hypothetical protein